MNSEYPYQLVSFLDREPEIGEKVYSGKNGWYPQIALKRRFRVTNATEEDLQLAIAKYCSSRYAFTITTGGLVQSERMPVKILEVDPEPELMAFHINFIEFMDDTIQSRYPERDGVNYLPHITAEYDRAMVIDADQYSDRRFVVEKVFLLKDTNDENSVAYASFALKSV